MKIRPVALGLGESGGEALGLGLGQREREALGEILDLRPFGLGRQRHDDMHALAAGQHREGGEAHVGEMAS